MKKTNYPFKFNIIIGSDHRGFKTKERIIKLLKSKGFNIQDVGTHTQESCDYPKYALAVAKSVSRSNLNRGILVCKTGIGNSIVANKVRGVRAALCYNVKAARLSREHNNANVLVLGTDFVRASALKRILDVWLKTKFLGGRHKRRVKQIIQIEKGLFK